MQTIPYVMHHPLTFMHIDGSRLEMGANFFSVGGVIYDDKGYICATRSITGKKHFARDDDGHGMERGALTYAIAYAPREKEHSDGYCYRFSEKELKLLENKYSHWLRQKEPLLFSDDFFTAKVEDLQELADKLGGIKCTK